MKFLKFLRDFLMKILKFLRDFLMKIFEIFNHDFPKKLFAILYFYEIFEWKFFQIYFDFPIKFLKFLLWISNEYF